MMSSNPVKSAKKTPFVPPAFIFPRSPTIPPSAPKKNANAPAPAFARPHIIPRHNAIQNKIAAEQPNRNGAMVQNLQRKFSVDFLPITTHIFTAPKLNVHKLASLGVNSQRSGITKTQPKQSTPISPMALRPDKLFHNNIKKLIKTIQRSGYADWEEIPSDDEASIASTTVPASAPIKSASSPPVADSSSSTKKEKSEKPVISSIEDLRDIQLAGNLKIKETLTANEGNGAQYVFFFKDGISFTGDKQTSNNFLAEWHTHWNLDKSLGRSGWKKGSGGNKIDTTDHEHKILREILAGYWKGKKTGPITVKILGKS